MKTDIPLPKEEQKMAERVKSEVLLAFATQAFVKVGMPEEDAAWSAETLVQAELRGVSSHGIIRLPGYVKRFEAGMLNPKPEIRVVRDGGAIALLDGDNGMGQVVSRRAMEDCIARAEKHNIGVVFLKGSNHFGMAATYACLPLNRGMVGFCTTNTGHFIVPFGGKKRMLGNDPIALAIPGNPPIVLDMALSTVARGYLLKAARANKSIPEGWGVDAEGRPTTDPNVVLEKGSLAPIGGYKGSGLSIAIDALLGAVAGEGHSHEVIGILDFSGPSRVPHLFAALRIEALVPLKEFRTAADAFCAVLRASPKAPGGERIWMPGEIEEEHEREQRREGIPLPPERVRELDELAKQLGLPPLKMM